MQGKNGDQWIGATAYADDLTLSASSPQQLNEMLTVVQQWAEDHSAKINYDKSFVITFNETAAQRFYRTNVEGTNWGAQDRFPFPLVKSIEEVREVKYLGITVDDNLDMNHHCTEIVPKIKWGPPKSSGTKKPDGSQENRRLWISTTHYASNLESTCTLALHHKLCTTNTYLLKTQLQISCVQAAARRLVSRIHGHNRRHLGTKSAKRRVSA